MTSKQRRDLERFIKELEKSLRHYEKFSKKFPATREEVLANPAYNGHEATRDAALMFAEFPQRAEETRAQIKELRGKLEES